MSKMKTEHRKPPLAKSPIRLRPRRVLRSNSASLQTPPGSLTKSQKPIRSWAMDEPEIRPEYRSISCELRVLAKMVRDELGNGEAEKDGLGQTQTSLGASANSNSNSNCTPLFERGRFYDEYSARRNERLKRKKGETEHEPKTAHRLGLGVTVESVKRRESKKLESLRKSMSAAYSVERNDAPTPAPRYLLRSMSKETNKKPPLAALALNNCTERKTTARRARRP